MGSLLVHDDTSFLEYALVGFLATVDKFAFVSRIPWHNSLGDWESAVRQAETAGTGVSHALRGAVE